MTKNTSEQKILRLVKAQTTLENVALSRVSQLAAQLNELELKLEKSQQAVSRPSSSTIFTDLYIRHIHRAMEERSTTKLELEAARADLQTQRVRTQKLQKRLREVRATVARKEEESALLDQMDRSFG